MTQEQIKTSFTFEELSILMDAFKCYDLELACEDDEDYPIFLSLLDRFRGAYFELYNEKV